MPATRAYKTELALNNQQTTAGRQLAAPARWVYNWCLRRKQEAYRQTGTSPSAIDLHREPNTLKQMDVPWMYKTFRCAPQEALRNLDQASAHCFRRAKLKAQGQYRGKLGYPKLKTKKRGLGSFRLTGSITAFSDAIRLPLLGRLRPKERRHLPTRGVRVVSATFSKQAGHWYVSIQVEQEHLVPANSGPAVGVDLGMKTLATLSHGTGIPNLRPLKRRLKKIKRLQRAVSRKQKGSNNRGKASGSLGKQHRTVANQRANTLHQVTTRLANIQSVVVIEDLHLAGPLENHHLAQATGDVGFGEFRRQLTYKAAWYGSRLVLASQSEPSCKTCSGCGSVDADLTLADRVCRCETCGLVLDSDLNAATNLAKLADSSPDSHHACGEGSAGLGREVQVKLPSVKQEPDCK